MHKTIVFEGQEYELQIAARKVINDGKTAVSMDNGEVGELLESIETDLALALYIIDYAVEQRKIEASYESDEETKACFEGDAEFYAGVRKRLTDLLGQ